MKAFLASRRHFGEALLCIMLVDECGRVVLVTTNHHFMFSFRAVHSNKKTITFLFVIIDALYFQVTTKFVHSNKMFLKIKLR